MSVYTHTDPAIREPSPCEVCKYFATELMSRLKETSSKEVIETGHGLDRQKKFLYQTSELRLTEALLDPHVCDKILQYNVHAERKGSLRYEKGMSETMSTLHALQHKGVKVELGFPEEMWDQTSSEVSKMQRACYTLSEAYEDVIEEWYYHHQESRSLVDYMCRDRYLVKRKFSNQCLIEERDDKLVDKDRQLAADYDIRDKTASKKEKEARKEWAEIKQRTREQEEADLAAGKGAKGDSGSVRERSERIKKNEL